MVVLTSNFTVLASLAAVASFALLPHPADAAAVEFRRHESHSSTHAKVAQGHSSSSNGSDGDQPSPPVVPLPQRKHSSKDKDKSKGITRENSLDDAHQKSRKSSDSVKEKRQGWNPLDPLFRIGPLCIGISCPAKREDYPASGDQHLHVHTGDGGEDKISIKGRNDYVHFDRRSPSPPEPRRSHGHRSKSQLVVNGERDHLDVYDKRAPTPHDHDRDHHSDRHGHDRHRTKLVVNGDDNDIDYHHKRGIYQLDGVPGSIDIMSQVAGSSMGQRIASLALSPNDDGTVSDGDPFILNASGANTTQVFLVAMPDSSSIRPLNQTMMNSTMSNATVSGPSSLNSTSDDSYRDAYRKVFIQIPLFDSEEATVKPYCATFDPRPIAPAPLTVESCADYDETDAHKSQTFAFEPHTGVIRPMWFEGQDDGTQESFPDSTDDGGIPGDDADNGTSDENVATVDPGTPRTSKMVTATGLKNVMLDEEFGNNTRPPNAMASLAKSLAAANDDYSTAKNVTLVFTPAIATIPIHPGDQTITPQEKIATGSNSTPIAANPSSVNATSSGSSNSTSPSMSTSSILPSGTPASTTLVSSTASHTFSAAGVSPTSTNATGSSASHSAASTSNSTESVASSTSSTASVTFSPFAAFATTTAVSNKTSSSVVASSTGLSSPVVANSTSTGSVAPTASALDVEVYDPNATSSSVAATSTSVISMPSGVASNASTSSSSVSSGHVSSGYSTATSSSAIASSTISSASATMTPFMSR